MKVCLVNPVEPLRRPIKELAPLLARKGCIVGVMAPRRITRLNRNLKALPVCQHSYRAFWLPTHYEFPLPLFGFIVESWRVMRSYDIIHIWANFYLSSLILFIIGFLFPQKKMILAIDALPGYSFRSGHIDFLLRAYTQSLCKLIFWRADVIQLYCEELLIHAKKAGIPRNKIVILPTGLLKPKNIPKKKSRAAVEKELGFCGKTLVLFIGLINKRKGVDIILSVAGRVKKENYHFLIIGDGPDRKCLESEARKKDLPVTFLGYRTDKERYLAASDIFFLPSRGEGLAGVIMEAMSYGLPVITTKIPCSTSLVRNKKEGILCPVDDIPCFVKALKKFGCDKKFRESTGRKSFLRSSAFYWRNFLPLYLRMYGDK